MLVLDSCWVSGGRVDFTQHLFIWQLNVSNMVQMMMMMMMLFTFTQLYSILQYLFVPWVLFFFLFSFSLYIQTEEIKNDFVFLNRRFVLSPSFWIISCPTVKYIHHNNPKVPTRNISARHCDRLWLVFSGSWKSGVRGQSSHLLHVTDNWYKLNCPPQRMSTCNPVIRQQPQPKTSSIAFNLHGLARKTYICGYKDVTDVHLPCARWPRQVHRGSSAPMSRHWTTSCLLCSYQAE